MKKTLEPLSLASKDYVTVSTQETVAGTLKLLRARKQDFHGKLAYLYVTNDTGTLLGVLRTRDLLTENPEFPVAHVMTRSVVHVFDDSPFEDLLQVFRTCRFLSIPVTNRQNRLIGVIPRNRVQSYLRTGEWENQGRGFGLDKREEIEKEGIRQIVWKRLPWLSISILSGLICAYILGIFIGNVESVIALILFVPIIIGLAGSLGTQSARVTIRKMNEGQLEIKNSIRILGKEVLTAFTLGCVALLLASFIAIVWRKMPIEGIALGISIFAVMSVSSLLGMVLPVMFRLVRINPGFASGLFLLLICDTVALILYFTISLALVNPTFELT